MNDGLAIVARWFDVEMQYMAPVLRKQNRGHV